MATKKELLEQSQEAIGKFFKLADYLLGDDAPYDINEMPSDNPFYEDAKEICQSIDVDWDNMTHEESNRVVINMLADFFCAIQSVEKYQPVLTITFQKAQ